MQELAEYFNSIEEAVKSVFIKHPELRQAGKGRLVLQKVQEIYPYVNPDTVLRASRKLRSNKEKDFEKEQEWREFFKNKLNTN